MKRNFVYMIILILYISTHISPTIALNNEDINNEETIVFDNSTGFFGMENEGPLGLSTLRDELEFKGYNVKDNIEMRVSADAITKTLIKRAHILILINPDRWFKREEIALIKDFVVKGGKLLLIADTPESLTNMNKLARRFGAEFLGYYLGDEVKIESGMGEIYLISPIPISLEEEPDILLVTDFIEAKEWPSVWERPGKKVKKANFTVFAGIRYGKGSVAFLGDKDIFLNKNIKKGNNLDFALSIFDWFEHKGSVITYYPNHLKLIVTAGKKQYFALIIQNKGDVNELLNFKVAPYLKDIVSIEPNNIEIQPKEKMMVRVKVRWTKALNHITDFIIVERGLYQPRHKDYIKLEIDWYEEGHERI